MLQDIPPLRKFTAVTPFLPNSAVAIGNFDGIHLGHRHIITLLAGDENAHLPRVLLTFDTRPTVFFRHLRQPIQGPEESDELFTSPQKKRACGELGIDYLFAQPFTEEFGALSPAMFYQQILRRYLGAQHIVIGENFRFGAQRAGTTSWLQEQCTRDLVSLQVVPARSVDGEIISSTRIRAALRHGKVELASQLLGRPYLLEGSSVPGQKLGRTIGVPTLNLSPDPQLLPGNGVYAGYLWRAPTPAASTALPPIFPTPKDPQLIPAVINCGLRPTVSSDGNPTRHIEAHLLRGSYPSELYNYRCGIYFTDFIREERTFSSLALLQQQIHKDIVMAQEKLDV